MQNAAVMAALVLPDAVFLLEDGDGDGRQGALQFPRECQTNDSAADDCDTLLGQGAGLKRKYQVASRREKFPGGCCHKTASSIVNIDVSALDKVIVAAAVEEPFDFDAFFHANYDRVARSIARVVRDPARAEEIAVEAFWKLWRNARSVRSGSAAGWIYRTAVRMALDEVRKQSRRMRNERNTMGEAVRTPEEAHAAEQEREQVRAVLAALDTRQAELLLLRSNDLSYAEVAVALGLNPSSIGTLISRAQRAFRKEFVTRYGEPTNDR
jgi:RNA polymerase sigma-70 factor (ECF subfamily)